MPWCPKCKAEYREGFTECAACHVALVAELAEVPEQQDALPEGMEKAIAIYTAENRLEAERICDVLRQQDIAVFNRPAAFRQIQAYSGSDSRFGVEILVDAAQTARARQIIDELNEGIEENPLDEDELARLAEEQALETPEQPPEDNASFKLLPVVAGVIVIAIVLIWLITNR